MQNRQSKTLKDAFLVFIRHASPILLISLILMFSIIRVLHSVDLQMIELLGALLIIIYWPFQEWWMHKVLLHLPPLKWNGKVYEMNFAKVHRLHHESPKNIPLSFLPVSAVLSALIAFTSLFYWLSYSVACTCSWMAVASSCTLLYEWVHYLTHTDYKPKGNYYRRIWKLHRWHHYKNENYWFSFTIPWLDTWFNTGPDPKTVEHSETVRNLHKSKPS